jgi:2-methylcitrate dehydratase PrpD
MTGPPDTAAYPSQALAQFAAALRYEQIPPAVVGRTQELFLDWIGSALAGRGAPQTRAFERFADAMGPAAGPAEVLTSRRTTSPLFAAMINAAASHVAEQDDVHSGSVFHPGAVVFPPALATAQALRRSGRDFIAAAVAGYEVGIRVGEFLGRTHYEVFHTTGTAGAFAAAAAVGNLLRLDGEAMLHAFGSAGTQAAGLWEFLRDGADSKQLHTAKAAANGLLAANLAGDGFAGARQILEGKRGLAAGMSRDADPARLTDRLGSRWATAETSFKFHASCRHTHPAADALLDVMDRTGVGAEEVAGVVASHLKRIREAVNGGGPNEALCRDAQTHGPEQDPENDASAGFLLSFGNFQFLDLGDLTWNYEHALACPQNLIGKVDLYQTTHHGTGRSGPPQHVRAIEPTVGRGCGPTSTISMSNSPATGCSRTRATASSTRFPTARRSTAISSRATGTRSSIGCGVRRS